MFKYTVKRLFQMIIVLMVVTVVVFFLSNFLSDPVDALIDRATATAQDIAAIRAQLGLDLPILVQFKNFVVDILHGDFGESYVYKQPVLELIAGACLPRWRWSSARRFSRCSSPFRWRHRRRSP